MDDSDDDLLNRIERWARIMNDRVNAPAFAHGSSADQKIVERCAAREWCIAVRDKYGLVVDDVTSNPITKGVPDCFAEYNGYARVVIDTIIELQ